MKRYRLETIVGIFVVIGMVCIGYMTTTLGDVHLFGSATYPVYAAFTNVSGLRDGSPIEIYGINAGKIRRLTIDQKKAMAVIEMEINDGLKLYDDATASIKTAGLIGDRYVKIDPGGAGRRLEPGGWITQTTPPIDIEDLIGKFAFGNLKQPDLNGGLQ